MSLNIRIAAANGVIGCVLCGVASTSVGQSLAKEGSYDYTNCHSGVEHASMSIDVKHQASIREFTGTIRAATPGTFLDMSSYQCISLNNSLGSQAAVSIVCVTVDKDGDRLYTRFTGDGLTSEAGTISGTGKYVGIERTGKTVSLGTFPSAKPGTFQTCLRNTGTYKFK